MTVQFSNTEGHATLTLCGRLDTSVSSDVKAQIDQHLDHAGTISHLTLDANKLDYISSSGLRILLSLVKRFSNFKIVGVNAEVFDVLNMTGFVKLMTVERALRQVSLDGCEILGIGGVGTVYRLNDDTIIKVFREGTTMDEVRHEITMSKEAFVMGMPTAISFDVVQVGSQYGLVYELLQAHTLSTCIKHHPERLDFFARQYAQLFRQLHAIEVPAGSALPNALDHERQQVLHIRRYFPQQAIDLLLHILDAIPAGNRLLHLDLQAKNAMIQGDDELMLIDMGEMGYGHPRHQLLFRRPACRCHCAAQGADCRRGLHPQLQLAGPQRLFPPAAHRRMRRPLQPACRRPPRLPPRRLQNHQGLDIIKKMPSLRGITNY